MPLDKSTVFSLYARHINARRVSGWEEMGLAILEGRREGACIWDVDGRRYIDCYSGAGSFNVGRRNPEIRRALVEAMENEDLGDFMLLSEAKAELARRIAELAPGDLSCVMYGVGGGEINDYAIKLARGVTGRPEIVVMEGAYHGHTGFSLAGIGRDRYKAPFLPMVPGFSAVPLNDLDALERAVGERTAAVLLEPIQGEGGIHVATDEFLRGAREVCDRAGALLLFDEIQTAWGRTGRMFCCEHAGVVPDVMTLGKSLGGGFYPITAAVLSDRIQEFNVRNPYFHLSTFGGSDLGCRVGLATIDFIVRNRLPERAQERGAQFAAGFAPLCESYSGVLREVRQRGLMMGLQFASKAQGPALTRALAAEGILAFCSGNDPSVMRFMPVLTIAEGEVAEVLAGLDRALEKVASGAMGSGPLRGEAAWKA